MESWTGTLRRKAVLPVVAAIALSAATAGAAQARQCDVKCTTGDGGMVCTATCKP